MKSQKVGGTRLEVLVPQTEGMGGGQRRGWRRWGLMGGGSRIERDLKQD